MKPIWVKAHEIRKDGQLALVVPMEIKRELRLEKGQQFAARTENKEVIFSPVPPTKKTPESER